MNKKKQKRKAKNKRGRKGYNKIEDIQDFYSAINSAQVTGKPVYVYFEDKNLCSMAENVMKDSDIIYIKKDQEKRTIYKLSSNRKEEQNSELEAEELENEIFIFDENEI